MAKKIILLKGDGIRKEGVTVGTIVPGELVERVPTGIQVHGVAAEKTLPAIALEYRIQGKGIDDAYLVGDQVLYSVLPPGAEFQGLLQASSAAVVIGDLLVSAGDGTFIKYVGEINLTDNTTGTPADALEDVTVTPTQVLINNNFASVLVKMNSLLPGASGVMARAIEAITPTGSDSRCEMEII